MMLPTHLDLLVVTVIKLSTIPTREGAQCNTIAHQVPRDFLPEPPIHTKPTIYTTASISNMQLLRKKSISELHAETLGILPLPTSPRSPPNGSDQLAVAPPLVIFCGGTGASQAPAVAQAIMPICQDSALATFILGCWKLEAEPGWNPSDVVIWSWKTMWILQNNQVETRCYPLVLNQ